MRLILTIAAASIIVGILIGITVVIVLQIRRRHKVVDSLTRSDEVIGSYGIVTIPFDAHSRGKVLIRIRGATTDFVAVTDEARTFEIGEAVLVVDRHQEQLQVVSSEGLNNYWQG